MRDVAQRAGVSVATVSNVVNHRDVVAEKTRQRVLAAIEELGFVRSEPARQLRSGHSRIICLVVPDLGNPFFVDVVQGAEDVCRRAGMRVTVVNCARDPGRQAACLALWAQRKAEGVLLAPVGPVPAYPAALRQQRIPLVLVDAATAGAGVCSVSVDDRLGGLLAGRHLVGTGHRTVALVGGRIARRQIRDRREGLLAAMAEAGGPGRPSLVDVPTDGLDTAAGRTAGTRFLDLVPRPTAVVCVNDLLALGVLQTLLAAGVRVPEDVAVIGHDDIAYAAAAAVPLSSVRRPAGAMGRIAAQLLLDEITRSSTDHCHQRVVLRPEVLVRDSSLVSRRTVTEEKT
ncbi:LacI family DNA-binding transcriptional regulator [Streptomyces sp. NPDC058464]|uniref:LacI family DNA-binding transcriptional regulator n=1 Tax=Streptomyces sp. NPDC058464 TaxID=3346511 RepID=UPI0036650451